MATNESPTAAGCARVAALRTAAPLGGSQVRFPRDGLIFAEGDLAEHWYEVVSGQVRVSKLTADGRRQIIDVLFPGDVFGFDGWGAHATSAEAASERGATVIKRCRRRLEALADNDPQLARSIRALTCSGLARAHERLLTLGRRTATERVAAFLLEMERRLSPHRMGVEFDLPMVRTEIGDYLGLTMETVSRTISALQRAGLIALSSAHRLRICDHARLMSAAGLECDLRAAGPSFGRRGMVRAAA